MRIFLAGAGGAIGRRLTPLLRAAGHEVTGTTRSPDKAAALRYGYFYGPGTWSADTPHPPAVHIDAAAQAALLALVNAEPGIYNIADDDPGLSSEKAKRAFGFDCAFRIAA